MCRCALYPRKEHILAVIYSVQKEDALKQLCLCVNIHFLSRSTVAISACVLRTCRTIEKKENNVLMFKENRSCSEK